MYKSSGTTLTHQSFTLSQYFHFCLTQLNGKHQIYDCHDFWLELDVTGDTGDTALLDDMILLSLECLFQDKIGQLHFINTKALH